jgi:hypothetical protein
MIKSMQFITYKFIIKIRNMYKPKSPKASSKANYFSPSPKGFCRINYITTNEQTTINTRERMAKITGPII